MRILPVKEFNQIKKIKFEIDMENWKSENRYGIVNMPFLPMYIFIKDDMTPRKKGFVVSERFDNGDFKSHRFFLTRKEMEAYLRIIK